jgi:two-component system, OmpR family, response regulator
MAKILLVEDDLVNAGLVRDYLKHEQHTVDEAHDVSEAKGYLTSYQYDLLVLDWLLPDGTGIEVLQQYRESGGLAPVIMLTGKGQLSDKEAGLDAGADDYLTKPFEVRELSARIRALLRRNPLAQSNLLRCGNITLDVKKARLTRDDEEIKLLPTEYALLEFLMRNQERVFSPGALLLHVWKSDSDATENGVRTYVARLRQKIDTEGNPSLIKTVHGLGYKLEA